MHCGLYGNETADILAKKGTKIKTKPMNTLPFESAKCLIKTKFKNLKSNTQSGYLQNQKIKAGKT